MSLHEQIQADVKQAMREKQRERLTALRLVLSELQKAQKDGQADELAVLRRERKRRLEAAAAYADAGRSDLEAGERAEAELIGSYLPAQLDEQELRQIVEQAVADSGAQGVKEMGVAMKSAMAAVDGRAEGKRVSELVKETLLR
ncbi:MAG: GatB/YqeY domain-containing protein [Solirubrobacteraceae bacterium]